MNQHRYLIGIVLACLGGVGFAQTQPLGFDRVLAVFSECAPLPTHAKAYHRFSLPGHVCNVTLHRPMPLKSVFIPSVLVAASHLEPKFSKPVTLGDYCERFKDECQDLVHSLWDERFAYKINTPLLSGQLKSKFKEPITLYYQGYADIAEGSTTGKGVFMAPKGDPMLDPTLPQARLKLFTVKDSTAVYGLDSNVARINVGSMVRVAKGAKTLSQTTLKLLEQTKWIPSGTLLAKLTNDTQNTKSFARLPKNIRDYVKNFSCEDQNMTQVSHAMTKPLSDMTEEGMGEKLKPYRQKNTSNQTLDPISKLKMFGAEALTLEELSFIMSILKKECSELGSKGPKHVEQWGPICSRYYYSYAVSKVLAQKEFSQRYTFNAWEMYSEGDKKIIYTLIVNLGQKEAFDKALKNKDLNQIDQIILQAKELAFSQSQKNFLLNPKDFVIVDYLKQELVNFYDLSAALDEEFLKFSKLKKREQVTQSRWLESLNQAKEMFNQEIYGKMNREAIFFIEDEIKLLENQFKKRNMGHLMEYNLNEVLPQKEIRLLYEAFRQNESEFQKPIEKIEYLRIVNKLFLKETQWAHQINAVHLQLKSLLDFSKTPGDLSKVPSQILQTVFEGVSPNMIEKILTFLQIQIQFEQIIPVTVFNAWVEKTLEIPVETNPKKRFNPIQELRNIIASVGTLSSNNTEKEKAKSLILNWSYERAILEKQKMVDQFFNQLNDLLKNEAIKQRYDEVFTGVTDPKRLLYEIIEPKFEVVNEEYRVVKIMNYFESYFLYRLKEVSQSSKESVNELQAYVVKSVIYLGDKQLSPQAKKDRDFLSSKNALYLSKIAILKGTSIEKKEVRSEQVLALRNKMKEKGMNLEEVYWSGFDVLSEEMLVHYLNLDENKWFKKNFDMLLDLNLKLPKNLHDLLMKMCEDRANNKETTELDRSVYEHLSKKLRRASKP